MNQVVLVIDDSADVHKLLKVRLRPEGLTLLHAMSAAEGVQVAQEKRPDLILLDVDMPEGNGFDACTALKADPATASLPIIFLTGASDIFNKVRGFELGAVDYVTKPFDPAELRARVRAALRTKRYQDLLAARSQLDALTGLWNRAYFNQRLKDEVAASLRYGRKVCLVLLDVDHFKRCNDQFGHPFGDQVLEALGELLHRSLRSTDAPCRYGGEEFALILTETEMQGGIEVAERLRVALAATPFRPANEPVVVTASFGVCDVECLAGGLSVEGLVRGADDALYAAKRAGRDQVMGAGAK